MNVTEEDILKLGWEKDYREFQRKFDAVKAKIAGTRSIGTDLYVLKRANADADLILEMLTHVVWEPSMPWRKAMRRDQAELIRAAKALRSAVEAVEAVSKKASCYPGFWMLVLNRYAQSSDLKRQMFIPAKMLNQMRAYEKYARSIVELFGDILRKQAQLIRMEQVGRLIAYVRHATGRNFDYELARILTDAHEAVGINKQFSADQLKKLRQRHLPKP